MFGKRIWERIKSLAALFMMLGIWGGVVFFNFVIYRYRQGGRNWLYWYWCVSHFDRVKLDYLWVW